MKLRKLILLCCMLGMTATPHPETLIFVAQLHNGALNHDWFSADNWFVTLPDTTLAAVGRIPTIDDDVEVRTETQQTSLTQVPPQIHKGFIGCDNDHHHAKRLSFKTDGQ